MTRDEVVAAMRQAIKEDIGYTTWTISTPHIERYTEMVLARAAERAWIALVHHRQTEYVRRAVTEAIVGGVK